MDNVMISDDPFWRRVDIRGPEDCWLWLGGHYNGYGRYRPTKHGYIRAHRRAFELANGITLPRQRPGRARVPDVCHACDVRLCCNPAHLWKGTHEENNADRTAKNRSAVGVRHGRSKLQADDIPKIRVALAGGLTIQTVADIYDVNSATIWAISSGNAWKHIR